MMRVALFLSAACLLLSSVRSYSLVGTSASAFGGQVVLLAPPVPPATNTRSNRPQLEMKKGKANVPPQMRSQYARQKEMAAMREQMIAASKPGADGLPVFNLFVRTPRANMWYPCGSFKGDDRSRALASNYRDNGLLAGISKKQLDQGVAGSLYRDLPKLKESVCRAYPQLRKSKDELEYGYKLAFEGLPENEPINVVEPKEQKGVLDNIKGVFGGN